MGQVDEAALARRDKRAARRSGGGAGQAEWRGYINVQLSDDDKAQFDEWMRGDDPWETLTEAALAGVVCSVKRDGEKRTFLASLTQRNAGSVNAGLCVTARGKSAGVALFRCVFLVARLGVSARWEDGAALADDDRW